MDGQRPEDDLAGKGHLFNTFNNADSQTDIVSFTAVISIAQGAAI